MKSKTISILIICITALTLLTACQNTGDSTPEARQSQWGPVIQISQAPTIDAPVLHWNRDKLVTAWVDTDLEDSTIVQSMRAVAGQFLSKTSDLPLPPVFPFEQQLAPATENHIHLIWQDATYDDLNTGVRLWSSVVTPDLVVERGPIRLTDPPVYHYDTISNSDNSLWVVWSTTPASEPTLRARWVDPVGRPRDQFTLIGNGDWPVLVQNGADEILLFWLDGKTNTLYRSIFQENALIDTIRLTESPMLDNGDILTSFDVGLDRTHAYAIWNIERGNGNHEVWMATGLLDRGNWSSAQRLGIVATDEPYITGFNGGSGFAATAGQNWPQHAAILEGQHDNVVIAAQLGKQIGLIFAQQGTIHGYLSVVELDADFLLGPPSIIDDNSRHLYLAWSEPQNENTANLFITQTRN